MAKRASVAAAFPAKRQKLSVAPVKDLLFEACQPVLTVLRAETKIPGGTVVAAAETLCAALPFALRAAEGADGRHAFQEKMLDAVAEQLASAAARRKEVVATIEKEAADLECEKAQSRSIQDDITARLAEKAKQRDDAEEMRKKQEISLDEAEAALQAAKKASDDANIERNAQERLRDDFLADFAEFWPALKGSCFQNLQWRQRDQALKKIVHKLEQAGVESSLLLAIQAALKIHAPKREEFAQATISYAEASYTKHVEVLKESVDSFETDCAACAAAQTAAEASVAVATEQRDEALNAWIAAENLWVEETTTDSDHKTVMEEFEPRTKDLARKLAEAQADLAHHSEHCRGFEDLRHRCTVVDKASGEDKVTEEEKPAEEIAIDVAA